MPIGSTSLSFLFLDIQILDRTRRKVYSLITVFLDIH
nr:MAG TPA: hypothetical protein [Caudoviricetes sp.]